MQRPSDARLPRRATRSTHTMQQYACMPFLQESVSMVSCGPPHGIKPPTAVAVRPPFLAATSTLAEHRMLLCADNILMQDLCSRLFSTSTFCTNNSGTTTRCICGLRCNSGSRTRRQRQLQPSSAERLCRRSRTSKRADGVACKSCTSAPTTTARARGWLVRRRSWQEDEGSQGPLRNVGRCTVRPRTSTLHSVAT